MLCPLLFLLLINYIADNLIDVANLFSDNMSLSYSSVDLAEINTF